MFKMRSRGFEGVMAMLRNVAEKVPVNARKTMHRGADFIVKEAKLNAPVDTHSLEDSIRKEASYVGVFGRLQITIIAGGTVNGINVDDYAMEVHENYDRYRAGPGTLAKMEANPGRFIGRKFLERAANDAKERLQRQVIQAVMLGTKEIDI